MVFAASWDVFSWDRPCPLLWVAPAWTKFINMLNESSSAMCSRKAALPQECCIQVANVAPFLKLHEAPEISDKHTIRHELFLRMMIGTELMLAAIENCMVVGVLAAVESKVSSTFLTESCRSKLEAFKKEFAAPEKDPTTSFGGDLGNSSFNLFHEIKTSCCCS